MSAGVMIDASILYLTVEVSCDGTASTELIGYEFSFVFRSLSSSSRLITFLYNAIAGNAPSIKHNGKFA